MCGIAGIVSFEPRGGGVDRDELLAMREAMKTRGPDGAGSWFSADGRVGLAHRRLAIIDLSDAAAQPMLSSDGVHAIVFNGEIYNFRDLRQALAARGGGFRTSSDTEVLLELYREKGPAMLPELRGMFAFALWDSERRRLLLARDLYGIKPLYYSRHGSTVRLASQVKALLAGGRVSRRQDPAGVAGFFLRGAVPEPFTLYEEIKLLPAGCYAWADERGVSEPQRFASVAEILARAVSDPVLLDERERQACLREVFLRSVRYHLVADVRVGAFLSSGRDSTSVVALAREAGASDLRTVTLSFEEYRGTDKDEAPLAEEVARHYGTDHSTRVIGRQEFLDEFPNVIAAMDQPTVDAINSYFVSKVVAETGIKVALSGTGGDELLAGYSSFKKIPRLVAIAALPSRIPGLGDAVLRAWARLVPRKSARVSQKSGAKLKFGGTYAGAYFLKRGVFMPWELPELIGEEAAREGLARLQPVALINRVISPDPGEPYARMVALESCLYMRDQLLRDIDWASMAHSLEVRVPLVEHHLLREIAPLLVRARRQRKLYLARSPSKPLPEGVLTRAKSGFNVPVRQWVLGGDRGGTGEEFGMRGWARRLYDMAFRPEGGL